MDFVQQQIICRERNLNSQEAKSVDLCDSALAGTEISEVLDLHVTSLYIFSDFVQNDKTKYKIEQKLLKTKLNQTVMVREHFLCFVKFLKLDGWWTHVHL